MTLFLDCEFNGFGSPELISIALVSDQGGPNNEFYAVGPIPGRLKPWVAENVIPRLDQTPEDLPSIQTRLLRFLRPRANETIIADWPEDFIHLLALLTVPGGRWHAVEISMRLVDRLPLESKQPHNALSDARALLQSYRSSTK
jgi:hypothetical protein